MVTRGLWDDTRTALAYTFPIDMRLALLMVALSGCLFAQSNRTILVITTSGGDYIKAAGGTIALLIQQGYAAYVVQICNDEKNSVGLNPAETRLANNRESINAAKTLGIREVFSLDHKSGELAQVSTNELRNQLFGLIRHYKPSILFHPDPWVHYQPDWDQYFAGRAAEEFSYGAGQYVGSEFTKMGLPPVGVAEVYYYAANRPYRPGEGGGPSAQFRPVDISKTCNLKITALQQLETTNRVYAVQVKERLDLAKRPSPLLAEINRASINALIRAWAEELAETIGRKHGFQYGEEFNYNGSGPRVPAYIRERAKPIQSR